MPAAAESSANAIQKAGLRVIPVIGQAERFQPLLFSLPSQLDDAAGGQFLERRVGQA